MAAPTRINTWQMYAKDGRAVFITYDYENAPLGVVENFLATNLRTRIRTSTYIMRPHSSPCSDL